MKAENIELKIPDPDNLIGPPKFIKVKVARYSLTDAAKPYTRAGSTDICWGKKTLAKIVKWNVPSDFGGEHLSEIIYTYKIDNMPDWINKPEIQVAFPKINNDIAGIGKEESNLSVHLTNLGWESLR